MGYTRPNTVRSSPGSPAADCSPTHEGLQQEKETLQTEVKLVRQEVLEKEHAEQQLNGVIERPHEHIAQTRSKHNAEVVGLADQGNALKADLKDKSSQIEVTRVALRSAEEYNRHRARHTKEENSKRNRQKRRQEGLETPSPRVPLKGHAVLGRARLEGREQAGWGEERKRSETWGEDVLTSAPPMAGPSSSPPSPPNHPIATYDKRLHPPLAPGCPAQKTHWHARLGHLLTTLHVSLALEQGLGALCCTRFHLRPHHMPSQLHARTRPGPDAGMPKENFGVSSRPRIGGSISRVDTTYALVLPASCVTSPYRIEMFVSGTSSSGLPDQLTLRILHTVARQLRVNLPNVAPAIDGPSASTWYPLGPFALVSKQHILTLGALGTYAAPNLANQGDALARVLKPYILWRLRT
ncbi:predicted protein [Postia placenta Mad-698-R]|nr:predicted protein [Postia placenta Mad-698-R]